MCRPSRLSPAARLLALLAIGVLAGCDRHASPAAGGETGGTMIVAIPAEPKTLLPPFENTTQGFAIMNNIFDRLADIGPSMNTVGDAEFKPQLARSWNWAPDSLSIAFNLDSAARWHDGVPVEARDVVYTFGVYNSDVLKTEFRPLLSNIDSVSARDAKTAVFWFKRRTPQQFFDATYHMLIMPAHLLAQVPDTALKANAFAHAPVGSNRFRFVRWEPKARIEIMADTGNSRGRAKLDRVIWSIVQDGGAATVKLFSGDADLYENLQADYYDKVEKTPQLHLMPYSTLSYTYLGFNYVAPNDSMRPHPLFSDRAVRLAFSLGTNRSQLVRSVLMDTAARVGIGPTHHAVFPDTGLLHEIPYSLEHAKALLDSAGWRDTDGDGIRERDGRKLAFELLAPEPSTPRRTYALRLQEQYRALGADVKVTVLPGQVFIERLGLHQFDAYLGGWIVTPGMRGLPAAWSTKGPQNFGLYSNPGFDATIDSGFNNMNPVKARQQMARALQMIIDDVPAIWLYEPWVPLAIHRRIRVPALRADGWWNTLVDWSVDPSQQIERDRIGLRSQN